MPRACDLKRGGFVEINGVPHQLDSLQVTNPSARGAATLYHFRFRNMVTKQKLDQTVKGDELYKDADFEVRATQFLYEDQGSYTFMDQETFDQFELSKADIELLLPYLLPEMEDLKALISEGKVLAVEPPQKVTLEVTECDPVLKGASATGRGKLATCETGLVVTVPEYITIGEKIIIETATGAFVSRA